MNYQITPRPCVAGRRPASSSAYTSCSNDAVALDDQERYPCSQVCTRDQQGNASCSPNDSYREPTCPACCASECRIEGSAIAGSTDHRHGGRSPCHPGAVLGTQQRPRRESGARLCDAARQIESLGRIRCHLELASESPHESSSCDPITPCPQSRPNTSQRNLECLTIPHLVATSLHHSTANYIRVGA
jgi:hypothetical protein